MRAHLVALRRLTVPSRRFFASPAVPKLSTNVISTLESRGFIADLTHPELRQHVDTRTCIYGGVDPSAPSLHVGNLVALMGLLHFRLAGHDVLALIGGATGCIGDPSGRSTERTALEPDELAKNVKGITDQVHRFFRNGEVYLQRNPTRGLGKPAAALTDNSTGSGGSVKVLNNFDWFKGVSFLDFLRDVGKLAKVNTMISRDSVRSRLNSDNGISFTEFSYQLLQAYDFAHLHREHGCRIQLGGSDQWGNIVAGIDLIKRQRPAVKGGAEGEGEAQSQPAYGLTLPLLTTETGEKFGKSAGNAVWLDGAKTTVHDFYQFFYRLPDASVEQQLKLFTLLPLEQIQEVMAKHNADKTKRSAQKTLAREVTELVHGHDALQQSLKSSQLLYTVPVRELTAQQAVEHLGHEPFFHRVKWEDIKGIPITKLMVTYGLCASRAEAARLVSSKAVSVALRPVADPRNMLQRGDLIDKRLIVIKSGKKGWLVFYVEEI